MIYEKWYYNRDLKPQGPISREEIRHLARTGEIRPLDLICLDGSEWRTAQSYFEATLFPANQEITFEESAVPEWVVLVATNGASDYRQEGPLTTSQVRAKIVAGDINWVSPIWKAGLKGWAKIEDRPEFSGALD